MATETRRAPARGSWIPWAFVLFFVVVTAVNGVMIWFAMDSWTGLSSGQAYDRGLRYNHNLEAARKQAALGWQPRLTARSVGPGHAEATLVVHDAAGQALQGAIVEISFERPTREGVDFVVALAPDQPGRYRAGFALPLIGVWDAHVTIRHGDDQFVLQQRFVLH